MAQVYPGTDDYVAHLPAVRAAVAELADKGAARATELLASHKNTGRMHIEVTHGTTDSLVSLVDPDGGAAPAEFGHLGPDGTPVEGIAVLKRAFDL